MAAARFAVSRVALASACAVAGLGMLGTGSAAQQPSATAARTLHVGENAHLHLTSKSGFTLNEEGTAAGTIAGAIYIHLHIANNRGGVTAEVNIYPRGGSLSGHGSASYQVRGAQAAFSGTLTITRGTGGYAGAHASGLLFSGTIQRRSDAVAVQLSGSLTV
ncbi:MAG TPA: autotransporter [Solirubrobacteraceae bacterium]|nr:autotransporter [Solirubrobacteraceae bacterium]